MKASCYEEVSWKIRGIRADARSSDRGCGGGGGVSAEEWGRVGTKYWMHVIEMGKRGIGE